MPYSASFLRPIEIDSLSRIRYSGWIVVTSEGALNGAGNTHQA